MPRVVALGGGHGLAATLRALITVTPHLTAVVTVADDGGSSGRLRRERGALPPGDLRMALAALAAPEGDGAVWAQALQHRFAPRRDEGPDPLVGHPLGNLVLHALDEMTGDPVASLALVGRLVGARGRVLPVSDRPLDIVGSVRGPSDRSREIRGQVGVARARGSVEAVRLEPADPSVPPQVRQALAEADAVVLGPGSWFSSVLPHLLVPAVRDALAAAAPRVVVVLNLVPQEGETEGFTPSAHLEVLSAHAPWLRVHAVVVDSSAAADPALPAAAARLGGTCLVRDLATGAGSDHHDPGRLGEALAEAMGGGSA